MLNNECTHYVRVSFVNLYIHRLLFFAIDTCVLNRLVIYGFFSIKVGSGKVCSVMITKEHPSSMLCYDY